MLIVLYLVFSIDYTFEILYYRALYPFDCKRTWGLFLHIW